MGISKELILILVIASSLLLPPFLTIGGITLRVDDFILLVLGPFVLLRYPIIKKNSVLVIFLVFFSCMLLSTLYGYLFLEVPICFGDLNEFVRMIKYVLLILLASFVESEVFWRKYDKLMYYGSITILIISFIEYFNIGNLGSLIGLLYSSPNHIENMLSSSRRIVITGSDPNIAGFITMYFWCYYYLKILYQKEYKYILINVLLLLCIIATSSRTIFFSLILVCIFPLFFSKEIRLWVKCSIVVLGMLGIVLLFSSEQFYYLTLGMDQLSTGDNLSLNNRYIVWEQNLEYFRNSMWLGWGPAKAIHETVVDGEYILLLVRYGIIGVFVFLYMMMNNIWRTFILKDIKSRYLLLLSFVALIFMTTNNFFSGYQLFFTYVVIAIVALGEKKYNIDNSHSF